MTTKRKILSVVMDGVGVTEHRFGNAVALAQTPHLHWLKKNGLYTTLKAHGTAVGLPSDADMGNSEVGHNALGAGRVFDQGAKLVQQAIKNESLFTGDVWQQLLKPCVSGSSTLHFIGLLSDGNVHSHEEHLFALLRHAKKDGAKRVRIHPLFDGRDVGEKSAEVYVTRLLKVIAELTGPTFDIKIASGGGRMVVTMDRYEADWTIVQRGWHAHVLGEGNSFPDISSALAFFREDETLTDQYIPPYVITDKNGPVGPILDGDSVVLFNFRGDRAIEISRAFEEPHFNKFDRRRFPKIQFAGIMQYDGDLKIPSRFLVDPPVIQNTLSDHLVHFGVRQFACSETQKYGHVTYFWNGNRSGMIDKQSEEYLEIASDHDVTFDKKPWMKAHEITEAVVGRMHSTSFDFGRLNYANGDMVGHTGDLEAAVIAVATVDAMIGRLIKACHETNTTLIVTADHGNCDEMFDAKPEKFPNWETCPINERPKPKTSHTLNPVPFHIWEPKNSGLQLNLPAVPTLANFAATVVDLLGLPPNPDFFPSLVK